VPVTAGRHFARNALPTILFASFATCAFGIWRMKGIRWFTASLMAIHELVIFSAYFVAGMSVTGDWL
jgi:hypothetical protein